MRQPTPPETRERILELARRTPRLTQSKIAELCGVTQGFVSRLCIENKVYRRGLRVDHRIIIELSEIKPRLTHAEVAARVGYNVSHVKKIVQAHRAKTPDP